MVVAGASGSNAPVTWFFTSIAMGTPPLVPKPATSKGGGVPSRRARPGTESSIGSQMQADRQRAAHSDNFLDKRPR